MRFPQPWYRKSRRAWFVTLDGRQILLGSSKPEALTRYQQLMAAPRPQAVPFDSLLAIIDAFLDWVHRNRAPDTYEWYRYRLERIAKRYPDMRATEIRPHHVETWINEYDFSVTSRRNHLRSIKRCFKWATKQGFINANPLAELELPAAEHREILISAEQYDHFCSYIRNPGLGCLVTTTWETGCRPQESLRVEARHVDLENQRWVFPRSESKSKQLSRVVYLTDRAFEITRNLMDRHTAGRLFRNSTGKPWTTDAINCAFRAIRIRMGKDEMKRRREEFTREQIASFASTLKTTRRSYGQIVTKTQAELRAEAKRKLVNQRAVELAPQYSLYALRHSWATHALQKGTDPLSVAILMGHKDPSTLSRVYQHLSLNPKHMLEQARKAAG
ncbi:MAG: tyrosine-type recombinase/integrase [Pirellulales bacterium]|nr:tyrosine-type recombinase/integrase [Pirellulales bacterium]